MKIYRHGLKTRHDKGVWAGHVVLTLTVEELTYGVVGGKVGLVPVINEPGCVKTVCSILNKDKAGLACAALVLNYPNDFCLERVELE